MAQVGESDPRLRQQSMGELVKELSDDVSRLVRQELKLAQVEMAEKGRKAGLGAGILGGAGILALLALGTLTACLIALLAKAMDVWLAALIVTAVYGAGAGLLGLAGKERVSQAGSPAPQEAIETVKEDVQWAKTQLPSGSR